MFKAIKDILVLCTGNNCRSQMAQGYLKHFARHRANVYSAGMELHDLNPIVVKVMMEDGIDISNHTSNHLDEYINIDFDLLLTVCNHVEKNCSYFPTKALKFHYNFPDPSKFTGTEDEILNEYRTTRDMIKAYCERFIKIHLYSSSQSFDNFKL